MSHILRCYTLFNITNTGIIYRAKPPVDINTNLWLKQRNTQCNFDTILQVISMRSQPEIVSFPILIIINFKHFKFGKEFKDNGKYPCWSFDFEVQHTNVFQNKNDELGNLYTDCHGIPMIKCGEEYKKLQNFLNTSVEQRNIYFEKL